MSISIHCGTFESERYWREPDLALLPALPLNVGTPIVDAMDEMLFAFCKEEDILLTRGGMNRAHYDYLQSIGFRFRTNLYPINSELSYVSDPNIFQILNEPAASTSEMVRSLLPEGGMLEPFSVLPGAGETLRRYRLSSVLPNEELVSRVNAKSYSVMMRERLGIPNIGIIVEQPDRLLHDGQRLLEQGALLIKDDYGVSGKGNFQIDSERTLQRVVEYLAKQVEKGKRMRVVVEPLLDREMDFSCQFRLDRNGKFTLLSVQQLRNSGFAFGSSHSAEPQLLLRLETTGYFELMERIGKCLYEDGYFGDVCVDSMMLRGGGIQPLVEINARKSMSLIKHHVDHYLDRVRLRGCLTQLSVVSGQTGSYADVLECFKDNNVLFEPGRGSGVIPLTSGTLFPRKSVNAATIHKGKLYVAVAYRDEEDATRLTRSLNEALTAFGLRVVV